MKENIETVTALEEEPPSADFNARIGIAPLYSESGALPPCVAVARSLRIGRGQDCELALGSDRASREHAVLELAEEGVWVLDRGSRNGTYLNGSRMGADRCLASVGSILRVGDTLMLVVGDILPFLTEVAVAEAPLVGGARTARMRRRLSELASSPLPVLIQGETGTGKEQAARFLHERSGRTGAFVAVNSAAIPSDLVESELFGHARGAYSGAHAARSGLIRSADHGTLLLDEIGDLPLPAQAKLLRVLEDSTVRPVGQDTPMAVDVRFVAATNRPLSEQIAGGRFRDDLFHRLAAITIAIPPLRERREDIPLLIRHFLGNDPLRVSAGAMERFLIAPWPGNVRQLQNVVRFVAGEVRRAAKESIHASDLPREFMKATEPPAPSDAREQVERARFATALQLKKGNIAQVARELGMARGSLYDALHRLGINPSKYR